MRYERLLPFYHWLWKHWREKRYRMFQDVMASQKIGRMLDVGGSPGDWFGRRNVVDCVDCLNLGIPLPVQAPPDSPLIHTLQGDGRHLEFEDGAYEVVYSNSVIEHVGGWEDQVAFAAEMRRVGESLWVQTPAYECPVEPHYLGPAIHWLPESLQWFAARWCSVVGLTKAAGEDGLRSILATTRLLTKREFQMLFPDCEIHTERLFFVFRKSYIALRRKRAWTR